MFGNTVCNPTCPDLEVMMLVDEGIDKSIGIQLFKIKKELGGGYGCHVIGHSGYILGDGNTPTEALEDMAVECIDDLEKLFR